jgi:hypothetical protein
VHAPEESAPRAERATGGATQPGQKRELEEAPIMLRKASIILLAGTLLPWLVAVKTAEIPWGPLLAAKALACIAAWIIHQGYLATHGGKAVGFIAQLSGVGNGASEPAVTEKGRREKPSGGQAAVNKLKASLVPLLGWAVVVGALFLMNSMWPMVSDPDTLEMVKAPGFAAAVGEVLTLLLASNTYSHIFGYEHGGRFNPLFPLMSLGPGIAGLLGTLGAFGNNPIGGLGCIIVAAGGILACYVMVVSMKQAKIEGDRKRNEMREARKQARAAQRGKG